MKNYGNDLFLLMSNLAQMNNSQRIIELFIDAVNSFHYTYSLAFSEKATPSEKWFEIRMADRIFGYMVESGDSSDVAPEFPALLQNAIQMLSFILDRLYQSKLLSAERNGLKNTVDEAVISLKMTEEKYRSLFENINEAAALHKIILDENGYPVDFIFLDVNPTYEKLTNLKAKDIIGKRGLEAIPNLEKKWIDIYGKVAITGEPITFIDHSDYLDRYWEVKAYSPQKGYFAVAFTDVTQRLKDEALIVETNQSLQKAQIAAHIGSWRWYIQENRLEWSDEMYRIFGIDKQFFSGDLAEVIQRCIHPQDRQKVDASNRSVMEKGIAIPLEYRILHSDGKVRTVWGEAGELIYDKDGKPFLLTGIVQDITDRKRTETALKKSNEKYQSFISQSYEAIYCTEFEKPIDVSLPAEEQIEAIYQNAYMGECNEAMIRMYQYSDVKDLAGKRMIGFYGGSDSPTNRKAFRQFIESDYHSTDSITEQPMINGETRFFLSNNTGIVEDGYLLRIWGTSLDITDRINTSEALRESEERIRSLSDNLPGGIVYQIDSGTDGMKRRFTFISGGVEKYHEVSVAAALEDSSLIYNQVFEEDRELLIQAEAAALSTMTPLNTEVRIVLPSGETRWRLFTSAPRQLPNHHLVWDGIEIDITERKRVEEKSMRLNDIFENSLNEVYLFRSDTLQFIQANRSVIKNLGYTMEELQVLTPLDIKPLITRDHFMAMIEPLYTGEKEIVVFETVHRRKNGTLYDVEVHLQLLQQGNERIFTAIIMDITERKRAEENYREIFNSTNEAIFIHEAETGSITDVNAAMLAMYGFSEKDDAYRTDIELFSAEEFPYTGKIAREYIQNAMKEGPKTFEWHSKKKDGTLFWTEVSLKRTEIGGEGRVLSVVRDITERKRSEMALKESEQRFRLFIEASPHGIFVQIDGRFAFINPAGVKLFGASHPEELLGTSVLERFHPDIREAVKKRIQQLNELKKNVPSVQEECLKMDNVSFPAEVSAVPIYYEGKNGALVFFQDITARYRMEAALRRSEERFRSYIDNAPDGIFVADSNGNFVYANPTVSQLTLYTNDELLQMSIRDLLITDSMESGINHFEQVKSQGRAIGEIPYMRKDGKSRWWTITAVKLSANRVLGFCSDITEKMIAVEALRENEKTLRVLMDTIPESVFLMKPDGSILAANKTLADRMHSDLQAMIGKSIYSFVDKSVADSRKTQIQKIIETREYIRFEDIRSDRYLLNTVSPVFNENGEITQLAVIGYDITDRKIAEEAVRRSEERFQRISSLISDIAFSCVSDDTGNYTLNWMMGATERVAGYTVDEIHSRNCWGFLVIEEDYPIFKANVLNIKSGERAACELRIRHKNGSIVWLQSQTECFENPKNPGHFTIYGGLMDITERKTADDILKAQKEELDRYFNSSLDLLCIADTSGHFIRLNPEWEHSLGYTVAELEGKIFLDFVHPDDLELTKQAVSRLENQNEITSFENRYRRKDGAYRWIEWRGKPQGSTIYATARDITERKLTEESLQRTTALLEQTLIQSPIPMAIVSMPEGIILNANPACIDFLGIADEPPLVGKPLLELKPSWEDYDIHGNPGRIEDLPLARALRGERTINEERKIVRKDGSIRWELVSGAPIYSANRELIAGLLVINDITEQRFIDEALAKNETRLKDAQRIARIGNWELNLLTNQLYWSEEIYRIFEIAPDEFGATYEAFLEVIHPDDREMVNAAYKESLKLQQSYTNEHRLLMKDGRVKIVHEQCETEFNADGTPMVSTGTIQDITERKRTEEGLFKEHQNFLKAFSAAPIGLLLLNDNTEIIQANKSAAELVLRDPAEIIGMRGGGGLGCIHSNEDHRGCGFGEYCPRCPLRQNIEMVMHTQESIHNKEIEMDLMIDGEVKTRWLSISSEPVDIDGAPHIMLAIDDITDRKETENEKQTMIEILKIINNCLTIRELIHKVIMYVRHYIACDAVGIRIKVGDDFPYYETNGFSKEFVEAERYLCNYDQDGKIILDNNGNPDLECMCGNILCGRIDASKSFFTEKGAFWSNNTTHLLATTTDADRQTRTRNRCNGSGYQSVGLFPIRTAGKTIGLLQVNNHREGLFTPNILSVLQRISDHMAIALLQQQTYISMKESEQKYHELFNHMTSGFALHEMIYDNAGNPVDYRFIEVNPAFQELTGLPDSFLVGKTVKEVLPDTEDYWIKNYGKVASTGESIRFHNYSQEMDKYFDTFAFSPKMGQFAVVFNDITEQKKADEALKQSETELKKAQKVAKLGNWSWNYKSGKIFWSDEMYKIFGVEINDKTNKVFRRAKKMIHPEDLPILETAAHSQFKDIYSLEFRVVHKDGSIRAVWAEIGDKIYDAQENLYYMAGIAQDITERKKAEEALIESESRFRKMIEEHSAVMLLIEPTSGEILDSNESAAKFYGYSKETLCKMNINVINTLPPEQVHQQRMKALQNHQNYFVFPHRLSSGEIRMVEVHSSPITIQGSKMLFSIIHDITERQTAEEKLKSSLAEKEVLLRELYHRTKNSLNTIAAFVQLQKIYTPDDTLNGILNDVVSRIQSMALVHQMLYQTKDLSKVDLSEYITNLMLQIYDTYNVSRNRVQINYSMKKVETLIDTAIPCGLVINELITNCFKHAFPGEREGVIEIGLDKLDNHTIRVSVQDNGIGLPDDFDLTKQRSIGMLTIVNLAEKQLQGHIDFNRKNGFGCTFTFPDNLYEERI